MLLAVSNKLNRAIGLALPALLVAAVVGFWIYMTSLPVLRAEAIVTALGIAHSVEVQDGDAWFVLQGNRARYGIARPDDGVLNLLRASEATGNAVSLQVHLDGARFGVTSNDPEYWVHSVEYLGKRHGKFDARIRWSWRDLAPGDAGLLHGFALQKAWRYEDAVNALDSGIGASSLHGARLALAHLTRGDALDSMAYSTGHTINDRDDRLLVRAIADFRQAAALDPSDHRALLWQGNATRSLGAYDEALALYEELERRWPEQYFRLAILRGATYRQLGKFEAALQELDTLVKEHGPQDGMMYHYHRGWTLNELQRYPEAVQEFTAGLRTQPDYVGALGARSCAYAQQGKIERALADQKLALKNWDVVDRLSPRKADSADRRAEFERILRKLEEALQSAPNSPNDAPCDDSSGGPLIKQRKRSPLFEPLER